MGHGVSRNEQINRNKQGLIQNMMCKLLHSQKILSSHHSHKKKLLPFLKKPGEENEVQYTEVQCKKITFILLYSEDQKFSPVNENIYIDSLHNI